MFVLSVAHAWPCGLLNVLNIIPDWTWSALMLIFSLSLGFGALLLSVLCIYHCLTYMIAGYISPSLSNFKQNKKWKLQFLAHGSCSINVCWIEFQPKCFVHYKAFSVITAVMKTFWNIKSFEFISSCWEATKQLNTVRYSSPGYNQRIGWMHRKKYTELMIELVRLSSTSVIFLRFIYSKSLSPDCPQFKVKF